MSGLKVSKSNDLLLQNYLSECNKLFILRLENSPRFFGSSPIRRKCVNYLATADGKLFTLTSLVHMWTPQQKAQCILWLRNLNQSRVCSVVFEQNGMSTLRHQNLSTNGKEH
ncbi:uncharacterized protein TNCV_250741 [Trichonephila clavipes]|nr:uncharacterized protein TNCV_250741 [Trichonephila clavipes]